MQDNKRGQKVCLFGLVLQLVLTGLTVGMWRLTGSAAAGTAVWLVLAPVPIWLWTLVLFYCRFLRAREEEELAQLAAKGASESIFTEGREVRPARRRVQWMERYLVPVFTLLLAGYHAVLGVLLLGWLGSGATGLRATYSSGAFFFALGGAFAAFLFSRYATGMAKEEGWRLLRAPGSYLFTDAVIFLLLAVAYAVEYMESDAVRKGLAYALPVFLLVLAVELLLNFVLDLYRPRLPGAEHRFSYDSRLLNLISSPESIGHSIAEALNYQFGFEVSSTWFYQLLQRALAPLLLAGVAVMWLLTSVVVVEEGEQYVVLHWGRKDAGRLLQPRRRPYLIWPWPIDQARKFQTGRLHELLVGVGEPMEERLVQGKRLYLWTEEGHGPRRELDVLVAISPLERRRQDDKAPAVSILKLVVAVYYRITDPYKFGYTVTDPEKFIESIACREMVQYAASATLDDLLWGGGQRRSEPAAQAGRRAARAALKQRIAGALAGRDLGIEVVDVQLLACHPSKEAAPAFEGVIAAERDQDRLRYAANAHANRVLAEVVGDPDEALRLAQAIGISQEFESLVNQREPSARGVQAGDFLRRADAEMEKLDQEIKAERPLGRLRAGRPTIARELRQNLKDHADRLEKVRSDPSWDGLGEALAESRQAVEALFSGQVGQRAGIRGQAAVIVDLARAYRWKTEFADRARAENFDVELMALRAAPTLYRLDKYLQVLSEGLAKPRKYLLGLDRDRIEVWLDLKRAAQSFADIRFGQNQ